MITVVVYVDGSAAGFHWLHFGQKCQLFCVFKHMEKIVRKDSELLPSISVVTL